MNFALPELGEGVYEAEMVRWLVKPGDRVKRGQPLLEVMTDKATMEVPSPFSGIISDLRAKPGAQLKVGDVVLTYGGGDGAVEPPTKAAAQTSTPSVVSPISSSAGNGFRGMVRQYNGPEVPVKAAPSVRLMARKLGIDINRVRGTGPKGRILIEDLATQVPRESTTEAESQRIVKPDYGIPGTRIKLNGLRRVTAERMVKSKTDIPHYSYVDECDVSELVHLRDGLRDAAIKTAAKVTYLAFFIKAVAAALREVPLVNATLDESAGEIVLHDRYNVGFAVATPNGLIVPVIHTADKKDLLQIASDIERLSSEARAAKAKLEDLRGGTFTVTSVGNIGGLFSTPIINPPEVGILGLGKVVKRPIFDAAGQVKAAEMIYLSFSFDHRVVDGAVGAAFGNAVIRQLRNPVALLLPV
jgi:pyruvate dehydrogenase E2 component (dihydrolipoamide acetyltransferase)/2-oxoisovalerate dehydrogenase E2 component (dihydrolipoyl transacylase)